MPRYEIVAHFTCDLAGATAEDAAAEFHRQVLANAGIADEVLQLAVWRQEPTASGSPLPTSVRQQLIDFFTALERSAEEAETAFRQRVEAILTVSRPAARDSDRRPADPRSHSTATRNHPSRSST
jgi:hypothetical protein